MRVAELSEVPILLIGAQVFLDLPILRGHRRLSIPARPFRAVASEYWLELIVWICLLPWIVLIGGVPFIWLYGTLFG
jgi:hypothetical protein